MAALGIPLALLLGAAADLVASFVRSEARLRPVLAFRAELRRALTRREPTSLLAGLGAGAALLGAGLITAAAIGASPGDPGLLMLALALAVVGSHLAASERVTRPAAARARARALESALVYAGAAAGLGALFLRWRADDLTAVWGAGEILGFPLAVGPAAAAIGQALALLAVAAAAGLLTPLETEPPRGRHRRPAAAALLLRMGRWGLAGALAALVPAFAVGFDLVEGGDAPAFARWAGVALVASAVVGAIWGALDRLGPRLRLRASVPALLAASAAAVVLVSVGR